MSRVKKIFLLLLVAVVVPLVLGGCLEFNMHLTINPNRTADLEIEMNVPEILLLMKPELKVELGNYLGEKKGELAGQGFEVIDSEKNDGVGFRAAKRLQSVEDLAQLGLASDIGLKDQKIFTVKKNILTTTYYLDADLDLGGMIGEQNGTLGLLSRMRFVLTLPVRPLNHNADTVTEDERTLEWVLSPMESNNLQLTARAPNLSAVIIGIVLIVALPGSIIIVLVYRPIFRQVRQTSSRPK